MNSDTVQLKQWTQADFMKLLDNLFKTDLADSEKQKAFDYIESNFDKQPQLIGVLIEYYIIYSVNSPHSPLINSNSKSIIDLICSAPDLTKLLDEINKVVTKFPMLPQTQQGSLLTLNTNYFERVTNLVVWLVDRKKHVRSKLVSHQLLQNIIKTILKLGSSITELITVHSSILIVFLINTMPSQMLNLHSENIFQIFVLYFKYLSGLEQNKSFTSSITLCSVKWSVRLYFYVCYGFYSNQLIQFLKKKEPQIFNKEIFTNMFVYLRLHPNLFNEAKLLKTEPEKSIKQMHHEDDSLEWRQYCLDPLYTNFNQIIQNMDNYSVNNTPNSSMFVSMLDYSNLVISTIKNKNNNQRLMPTGHGTTKSGHASSNTLTTLEAFFSSNKSQSVSPSSVPTTPTPIIFSQTPVFQYPSLDQPHVDDVKINNPSSYQLLPPPNKNTIVNLTTQFMNNPCLKENNLNLSFSAKKPTKSVLPTIGLPLRHKQKSKSDSNIFYEPGIQYHGVTAACTENKKQTKSEMRDTNIVSDSSQFECANLLTSEKYQHSIASNENDGSLFNEMSLFRSNNTDMYDIINSIHSNLKSTSSTDSATTQTPNNSVISKLKEENNHLILQLAYERSLRQKYEEESNRLHIFKIERDQLLGEKIYIEKYLKDLVEQYKNDVENILFTQNKTEMDAYKKEIEEKKCIIEKMQKIVDDTERDLKSCQKNCESLVNENKNLERALAESTQLLEKEQNIKTKYEIDYQYMNSLKYTTDILRRKLLLMAKAQSELKLFNKQQMQSFYNQELNDLAVICNNISNGDQQFDLENSLNSFKPNETGTNNQKFNLKPLLLNAKLYEYQHNTIENLNYQIDSLKHSYNQLVTECNGREVELEICRRTLSAKEKKLEELEEVNSAEMNAELMKNQHRVYSSLMNVNKRLEEEIFMLKAKLSEANANTKKLEKKYADQNIEIQALSNQFNQFQSEKPSHA